MSKHRGTLQFVIDGDPDSDVVVLEAVDQGQPWNGWRTPIVTYQQFADWVERWAEAIGMTMHVFVSSDTGNLTLVDLSQCRVEEWEPIPGQQVDGQPVFRIDGWVWSEWPERSTCDHAEHDGLHAFVSDECIGWVNP